MSYRMNRDEKKFAQYEQKLEKKWDQEYNLISSNNGLKPYIEKIKKQMSHSDWRDRDKLALACDTMGVYYDALIQVGAPKELIFAAYGQYLWFHYGYYNWDIKYDFKLYQDRVKRYQDSQAMYQELNNKDPKELTEIDKMLLKSNEAYLKIGTDSATSLDSLARILADCSKENGNLVRTLRALAVFNHANNTNYTPSDMLDFYFKRSNAYNTADKAFEDQGKYTQMELREELMYLQRHRNYIFSSTQWDDYDGRSAENHEMTDAKELGFTGSGILNLGKEFLDYVWTQAADYINILVMFNDKEIVARLSNINKENPDALTNFNDFIASSRLFLMMDVFKYFGYDKDNLPDIYQPMLEKAGGNIDLLYRNYEKYPAGYHGEDIPGLF